MSEVVIQQLLRTEQAQRMHGRAPVLTLQYEARCARRWNFATDGSFDKLPMRSRQTDFEFRGLGEFCLLGVRKGVRTIQSLHLSASRDMIVGKREVPQGLIG
jgi:hypothetical protein